MSIQHTYSLTPPRACSSLLAQQQADRRCEYSARLSLRAPPIHTVLLKAGGSLPASLPIDPEAARWGYSAPWLLLPEPALLVVTAERRCDQQAEERGEERRAWRSWMRWRGEVLEAGEESESC